MPFTPTAHTNTLFNFSKIAAVTVSKTAVVFINKLALNILAAFKLNILIIRVERSLGSLLSLRLFYSKHQLFAELLVFCVLVFVVTVIVALPAFLAVTLM